MNVVIENTSTLKYFMEYFDYNDVVYHKEDFFTIVDKSTHRGGWAIPEIYNHTLCIMDINTVIQILSCELSTSFLQKFLDKNNILWIATEFDFSMDLCKNKNLFDKLEKMQKKPSVVLWLDTVFLKELNYVNTRFNTRFYADLNFDAVRIKNTVTTKNPDSKDFMLTMIVKDVRTQLLNEINKRQKLLANSLISARPDEVKYNTWLGDTPHQHTWYDGFPSMDLYNNSWFEIVPETYTDTHYFITEKTLKPICTKTPFLVLSTPGYLEYLKSLGFKTFSDYIDESYDDEENVNIRIQKILDVTEEIITQGPEQFYNNCKDILQHNFNKYCELSTKKMYLFDNLIYEWLQKAQSELT